MNDASDFELRVPQPKNTSDPRLADLCFEKGKAWAAYDAASKTYYAACRALDDFIADVTTHQIDFSSKQAD